MFIFRHSIASLFVAVLPIVPVQSKTSAVEAQASEDFKLTEVEPYYTRYQLLTNCVRTMLPSTDGTAASRAKLAVALCNDAAGRLRALLGSKIGIARASKVIELYQGQLATAISQQEQVVSDNSMSPGERLAKASQWSAGHWHVVKIKEKCVALHRFDGPTTFGGLSYAGTTVQDILIGDIGQGPRFLLYTPKVGYAENLARYAGKSVKVTISGQPIKGGKQDIMEVEAQGTRSSQYHALDLTSLDNAEKEFTRYKSLTFIAFDGNTASMLAGYSYNLTGLSEAIAAYRRCLS